MDFTDAGQPDPPRAPSSEVLATLCQDLERRAEEVPGISAGEVARLRAAVASYAESFGVEFSEEQDHFKLVGQDNVRRYLPVRELRVRVHPDDTPFDVFARVCAGRTVGCRVTVSLSPHASSPGLKVLEELTETWAGDIEFVEESDEQLAQVVRDRQTDRLRYAAPDRAPEGVLRAAADAGVAVLRSPVLIEGRVELLWYLQEQSLSIDYHRYGNLGTRASEDRATVG